MARQMIPLVLTLVSMLLSSAGAGELKKPIEDRPSLDLSGTWQFQIDPEDAGIREKWYEGNREFGRTIEVPGAWNAQGIAFESQEQLRRYDATSLPNVPVVGTGRESDRICHVYPGPGWYRRTIRVPESWRGKSVWLKFGGVHRNADVWINGRQVGTHVGYVVPFAFDVTEFVEPGKEAAITLRVDARRKRETDPLLGCMDTLDFLYVTWGGVHRKVTLEARADTWIDDAFVIPRVKEETAEVQVTTGRAKSAKARAQLRVRVEILDREGRAAASGDHVLGDEVAPASLRLRLPQAKLWSPSQPYLYTARVTLIDGQEQMDAKTVRFGMREFKVEGGRFLLNGRPIFLRGYGDDCIYPNTIAPPADKEEYRRRFQVIKDYGFNYARHHSWMPPEEYLDVADEMGVLLQPEFPIAYRWDLANTPEGKAANLRLWQEMIRTHRNHPSIAVWCMGNELYESFEQAPEMYRVARQLDPTRPVIDSDGVARKPRPTLDFWIWQFNESGSFAYKDAKYKIGPTERPVVAHEMGYFVTLPNLTQLDLFRSGLKPYWLTETRTNAQKRGVVEAYPQWLDRSNRLQTVCLKTNIEAVRRSNLQGYHVWLFQDYPNCAEGVVDMFFRPKKLRGEEFRRFNAPTVLLIGQDRRNYYFGEKAEIPLSVSRYEDEATRGARLRWELRTGDEVLASGEQNDLEIPCGEVKPLPAIALEMPRRPKAERLRLVVRLEDAHSTAANDWDFWVLPKERLTSGSLSVVGAPWLRDRYAWAGAEAVPKNPAQASLVVTDRWDPAALEYLAAGGRVLLLNPEPAIPAVASHYRPSGWDPTARDAHVGTVFDPQHPAMRRMPSEGWCDLQFHDLVQGAKMMLLEGTPATGEPLVRVIDMPQRLDRRAYLVEAKVGQGRLLASGFNFAGATADPAADFFLDTLIRYALGDDFHPSGAIPVEYLRNRLPSGQVKAKVDDSAALGAEVRNKGWIAFSAPTGQGDWDLFLMRPDGSGRRKLTDTRQYNEAGVRFSPDGKKILYYRMPKGVGVDNNTYGTHELVVADADGSHAVSYGALAWASWGPDGKQVACLDKRGIQIVDLESRKVVRQVARGGIVQQLGWSPDGKWFTGTANGLGPYWNIGRLNAATGAVSAVSEIDRYNCTPDWAPDSQRIVYARGIIPQEGGWAELWVAGGDGKDKHMLYAEDNRHIYGACVSPDSRYLLFTRSEKDLGGVDSTGTRMAIVRWADTPMIAGSSDKLQKTYPKARRGTPLDLSWGWEPHWTFAEIALPASEGAAKE